MADESDAPTRVRPTFAAEIAESMSDPRWVLCPTHDHQSFLVDSDAPVGCPWCEIRRLRRLAATWETGALAGLLALGLDSETAERVGDRIRELSREGRG